MKRYFFYDKKTKEIVHTHQFYKVDGDDLVQIDEREIDKKEILSINNRMIEPGNTHYLNFDMPCQSSRKLQYKVDPIKHAIIAQKIPKDFWENKRIQKDKERNITREDT